MQIEGIDERRLVRESSRASFLVFIYYGGQAVNSSWAVDSRLITDADLPEVLHWLAENLPVDCCWALGVVREPSRPTTASDLEVAWIVGADVLNSDPAHRSADEQRIAAEMLVRRHHVTLS